MNVLKGRNQEAVKVIKVVCKWNKRPLENVEHLRIQDDPSSAKKGSFKGMYRLSMFKCTKVIANHCMYIGYCFDLIRLSFAQSTLTLHVCVVALIRNLESERCLSLKFFQI